LLQILLIGEVLEKICLDQYPNQSKLNIDCCLVFTKSVICSLSVCKLMSPELERVRGVNVYLQLTNVAFCSVNVMNCISNELIKALA
jgi:hypothetical protein